MDTKNLKIVSLISSSVLLLCTTIATIYAFVNNSIPMCIMCSIMSMILLFMACGDFIEIKKLEN